jgi:DNA-binding PadR family transcriptional regulator
MVDWQILSNDLKICYLIYKYTEKEGKDIWFSKLVNDLQNDVSRTTISKILDKLFDLGIIDGEWKKTEDGKWTRVFKIAGEAKDFIKIVYEKTSLPSTY